MSNVRAITRFSEACVNATNSALHNVLNNNLLNIQLDLFPGNSKNSSPVFK